MDTGPRQAERNRAERSFLLHNRQKLLDLACFLAEELMLVFSLCIQDKVRVSSAMVAQKNWKIGNSGLRKNGKLCIKK